MKERYTRLPFLWGASIVFAVGLTAANVVLGSLNQDEGWYLLAGLKVAGGEMPYRDFFFTQGPVMPLVYGKLAGLWREYGVLGGRALTAAIGLLAAWVASRLAAQLAPKARRSEAALTVWLLTACVPVHSYFMVIPKTYALASLLLVTGFLDLTRGRAFYLLAAGACMGLAAGTRVSMGAAIPVVAIALFVRCFKREWRWAWVWFVVGSVAALAATYGVSYWRYGDAVVFAQQYHAARVSEGWMPWLMLRVGFLSRMVQGYPLTWLLAVGLLLVFRQSERVPRMDGEDDVRRFADSRITGMVRSITNFADRTVMKGSGTVMWAATMTVLVITLAHGLSPFPYDDYQTPVMTLLAAVIAAGLWQRLDASSLTGVVRLVPYILFIVTVIFALSSPLLMEWVVIRKDRLEFTKKPRPDVLALREVGAFLKGEMAPGETLWTQDAYLAVEVGCDVPKGLEMGPFCLFSGLSDEEARRYHVHTMQTMAEQIATAEDAAYAATSGYAFYVFAPEIKRLSDEESERLRIAIAERYDPIKTVPDFGQGHTELTLWKRRALP
ncbi:MAG: DUF2029 domain-containing protein [Kiritimatiellaeota bacterium]|nr:DUF2029 domain-containing protein [Kiritimatiellota bacterium]